MQASPTGKAVQRYEKKQTIQILSLAAQHVVHVAGALLEAEEVRQGGRVGRDAEAVGLPLAGRHPGHGDVEAVQVIGGADLRGGDLHRHDIEAGGRVDRHPRGKLDVAGRVDRLREALVLEQLVVRILVRLRVTEAVAEVPDTEAPAADELTSQE